jgi:hypothetical protein
MQRKVWFVRLAVLVVALALGYVGWRTFRSSAAETCYACRRPIHAHTRTVASANGHSRLFCCPACALSQQEQAGTPVKVTQLTSFLTGKAFSPDNAWVVRGSDVNMCVRTQEMLDSDKRPVELNYDRCSPSLLAFTQQTEAAQFAREHGGEVIAFREVAAAFAQ